LKKVTYDLVIQHAKIQQLERRGKRIVEGLFDEFIEDPEKLIPEDAWRSLVQSDPVNRKVCDYIAGMTDNYAERIYRRLFIPGFGSSRDDL
jgi:dGTPase